jgi:hypothetical protein
MRDESDGGSDDENDDENFRKMRTITGDAVACRENASPDYGAILGDGDKSDVREVRY